MPINEYFDTIFATAGDRTPVPDAPQVDGSMSYTQGFTPPYGLPIANPSALPVPRAQSNQLYADITAAIQYVQQNGCSRFITTAMNGGVSPYSYNLGAMVSYDAGSGVQNWFSTKAANTTVPGDVGAFWVPVGGGTTVFIGDGATAGTANAQTLDTEQGNFANATNSLLLFVPGLSNTLSMTLAVDGESALTLQKASLTGLINLAAGDIVVGQAYFAVVNGGVLQLLGALNPTQPVRGSAFNAKGSGAGGVKTASWTAEEIVVSDTNGNTRKLGAFSQGVDAAVSGIGGHTGSLSNNNWYPVYAAYNAATGTPGAYIDATQNYSVATPPSGFSQTALISSVFIDGSGNILKFTQAGNKIQLGLPTQLATGGAGNTNTPVYQSLTVRGNSSSVPPNAVEVTLSIASQSNDGISVIVAPNANYGSHVALVNPPPLSQSNASLGGVLNTTAYGDILLESNAIFYAIGAGSGGSNQAINLHKFTIG